MPNWKAAGPDELRRFFISSSHDYIQAGYIPHWMVESWTVLIQKDLKKGNSVGNYRPIACLNLV